MSDDPLLVERLHEFGFEQFQREQHEMLEKTVVICVGIMVIIALLVLVLTGSFSVFWALLWGG
jgi:hypothetical protein